MNYPGRKEVEQIIRDARRKGIRPNLIDFDLNGADLSNLELVSADFRSSELYEVNFNQANLQGADLRGTYLDLSSFREANLSGAKLTGADLQAVDFERAKLHKAALNFTNSSGADFNWADLSEATLAGANLSMSMFRDSNLRGLDLNGATLEFTVFIDIDLGEVIGLDDINHEGPSTVGIDTIYRSKGKIPGAFLRGAGVPDTFITYIASLTGEAIQYYSCFISYSSKDQEFAQELHDDLQIKGVRCWLDSERMKIGDTIRSTIDKAIRTHDKLLLILSENSLNSDWVESEVEKAFEEERQRKQTVLFPIRLDEAMIETNQPWATEIRRTRHIGDFSRWKDHDAYQRAFERLLRDLKAED